MLVCSFYSNELDMLITLISNSITEAANKLEHITDSFSKFKLIKCVDSGNPKSTYLITAHLERGDLQI